jgi:hypothetical protein
MNVSGRLIEGSVTLDASCEMLLCSRYGTKHSLCCRMHHICKMFMELSLVMHHLCKLIRDCAHCAAVAFHIGPCCEPTLHVMKVFRKMVALWATSNGT